MPKEGEFFNAASAVESAAPSVAKASEPGGRSGSTSSAKYRVSSRPSNLLVPALSETPTSASYSPETRLSAASVSSLLLRVNKNSASRLSLSGPSGGEGSATNKAKNARYAEAPSPSKGPGTPKLPQKLRQHVNRLRNQFALGSGSGSSRTLSVGGRSPSTSASPQKAPRPSMGAASINFKRFSIAAAAAIQYSRRSNQLQQLQVTQEDGKQAEPVAGVLEGETMDQDPEPPSVTAGTFQDLLSPLQNSLSCASLSSEWSSDEDDEAEQLFRQSERENSRMLRVCCSIDNLMMSIGDQAQEQKQTEAIVRGATRDLVKLFQFALKQVVAVIFDNGDDPGGSNNINPREGKGTFARVKIEGKEGQYAMEFLLEINSRFGKLYEFVRSVFINEVEGLHDKVKELEKELAAAALKNEQLHGELRDLRDFHEQNNVSSVDTFAVGGSVSRHPVLENEADDAVISAFALPELANMTPEEGNDECSALKQQCQELSRFLEMAKQEIRLSHHERDIQKARVAEISSALFRDNELGLLRNQLQSEKKRVRVLERENLTLRESQQDQALKLQSLEALQVANSTSSAAVSAGKGATSIARHSGASRPSADTASEHIPAIKPARNEGATSPTEEVMPTAELTIETHGQYNFINAGLDQARDGAQVTAMNWFLRIVNPPQPANARKNRKKRTEPGVEQQPTVEFSAFLAGLLMTDKQLATAKEESKARRQGSIPTLVPPVGALFARRDGRSEDRKLSGKKRRPRSATSTSASTNSFSRNISAGAEDSLEDVVACCLQLVWVFYQRFLLAVEAQNLLCTRGLGGDPTLGSGVSSSAGSPAFEPVSLTLIMFHFFLERCSRELDATRELEQFVRCLHSVRTASYSLELCCQFLEETCSRQELCFFLWVCQAIDDVRLGIPYEDPLPNTYEGSAEADTTHQTPTQYLCVLKATFLARTIFRLLHFKVLCRPPAARGGKRRGKAKLSPVKRSNSTVGSSLAPSSQSASPKRKPRTRLGELTTTLSPVVATAHNATTEEVEEKNVPLHIAAQIALREIIESNQREPISLEAFNNLLLKFAVEPSAAELGARLGPFYLPTGEERKIPTDVFIALLMETYKFQLQWQRGQLCALFIHLNHEEEIQRRAAEKTIVNSKIDQGKVSETVKKQLKPRMKRRKSRDGAADTATGSKYLRGLSRSVLRELLVQSGIVHDTDIAQIDLDWLYAELLTTAGGVAADITFENVFNTLERMRWLDSTKLRVDSLMDVTNMTGMQKSSTVSVSSQGFNASSKPRPSSPNPMLRAFRDKWRVYARHSLALCNNDPNLFIRRHSRRLLHYVDQELARLVCESDTEQVVSMGGDAIQCVREYLAFAWRVAAKRSSKSRTGYIKQTCLTEALLVSQALRATVDSMPGYPRNAASGNDKIMDSQAIEGSSDILRRQSSTRVVATQDILHSFYDTSQMRLQYFFKEKGLSEFSESQLYELEIVLSLYSAHIDHLFQRFSEARYNGAPQVSFHRWRSLVYELELAHPRRLPLPKLQALFESVVEPSLPLESKTQAEPSNIPSLDQERGVGKTQFSELFVLIAFERHRVAAAQKLEKAQLSAIKKPQSFQGIKDEADLETLELADRPACVVAQFCREILAPRAFRGDSALVERNFAAKLSCPLVGRALLEHRAFLRTVFFFYAKQDEVAADERAALEEQALMREMQEKGGLSNASDTDPESSAADACAVLLQPDPGADFQLEKTKRSSMSFGEFQTFLTSFGLLEIAGGYIESGHEKWEGRKMALADAQHVFSSVMSLDNDDTLQLEFDEFAAAIVALAVHLNPNPFSLWYQKLDEFATKLQRIWEAQQDNTC
ncbi:unnamed protein product [Phytophthora lilii]|uniref:Unnamed protein product n=1 Tax=Phytophthora lilii TaxID=2077276 RepID=A0A9W6TP38_9STRA|nr:unnamed protein product [Phytophthora lilii]